MRKDLKQALERRFPQGSVIGVFCNQWGDTGKGKIVDLLMAIADVSGRTMGADNCGHTIIANGQKVVTHMIPSGILHDARGVVTIIGRDVAFNPLTARRELAMLEEVGVTSERLKISYRAKLTMPYHILFDRLSEARANPDKKIGTTGRGVGPVFQDYYGRVGLEVRDMLDEDVMHKKLMHVLPDRIAFLKTLDPGIIKEIMEHEHLENGRFFHPTEMIDIDAIIACYHEHGEFFRDMIWDTESYILGLLGRSTIVLEGAQGALLDVHVGSYPYVTSSRCTVSGLANGVGLCESEITHKIGVIKAYQTRVGEGWMPTEIGGYNAVNLYASEWERKLADVPLSTQINHDDPVVQGGAIGRVGGEFGATTGRLRRIGWLDLPAVRHARRYNGPNVVITKLDVLTGIKKIPVCVGYKYVGPTDDAIALQYGRYLDVMRPEDDILRQCEPVYEELDGWDDDISSAESFDDLPENAKGYIRFIEWRTGVVCTMVSVGPDREQTFLM